MSNQIKPQYTEHLFECPHCSNKSYMEVIAHAEKHETDSSVDFQRRWEIYLCPNCNKIVLYQETYCSEWVDFSYDENGDAVVTHNIEKEILYPYSRNFKALPQKLNKLYHDAKRLIPIDQKAALVKFRSLLEAICSDKGFEGKYLEPRLKKLLDNNIIPKQMHTISEKLKDFGNFGAHDDPSSEYITKEDVILMQKLCETILEYVYEAPAMLADLEQKLAELTPKQ